MLELFRYDTFANILLVLFFKDSVSSVDGAMPTTGTKMKTEVELPSVWQRPEGLWDQVMWAIALPLRASAYYTMPNCRLEKWRSWFLVSFFLSMLWISIYSYVMVWMITIIGNPLFIHFFD